MHNNETKKMNTVELGTLGYFIAFLHKTGQTSNSSDFTFCMGLQEM